MMRMHRFELVPLFIAFTTSSCNFIEQLSGTPQCDALDMGGLRAKYTVGDTATLYGVLIDKTGLPSNCLGTIGATFQSSAPAILELSADGKLRALAPGNAVVSAKSGKLSDAQRILVVAP
jgi:hypothetical protein